MADKKYFDLLHYLNLFHYLWIKAMQKDSHLLYYMRLDSLINLKVSTPHNSFFSSSTISRRMDYIFIEACD